LQVAGSRFQVEGNTVGFVILSEAKDLKMRGCGFKDAHLEILRSAARSSG
jgi:hypothetical protein